MRKASVLALTLTLTLLSGCAMVQQAAEESANTFDLYFAADLDESLGGDAIAAVPTVIEGSQNMAPLALAEAIVERLLEGPRDQRMATVIPKGTTLLGIELDGGHAYVDLSGTYSTLSGIQLTMADYCLTLSLTQISGIDVVSVTVRGRELAYRDSQNFRDQDVLLTATDDLVGTVDVTLWFLDGDTGALSPEQRTLRLYEGDTQAEVLLSALLAGPQSKGLTSALPAEFTFLSVWTEENICYVNLPGALCDAAYGTASRRAIRALVDSLCSLKTVSGVQIRVDGESRVRYGDVDISGILQPND